MHIKKELETFVVEDKGFKVEIKNATLRADVSHHEAIENLADGWVVDPSPIPARITGQVPSTITIQGDSQ